MILETQADDREPIEYTHYDCWGGDPEFPTGWSTSEEEMQRFFAELLDDWAKRYDMKELAGLAEIMVDIGLADCMKAVALSFNAKGFDVYDGEEFFEVYTPERG